MKFANTLATALSKALGIKPPRDTNSNPASQGSTLASGMTLQPEGARTSTEIAKSRVQVSCYDCGNTPAERKKILEKSCSGQEEKFELTDYDSVLDPESFKSVGDKAEGTESAFNVFREWAVVHDVAYMFKFLCLY